MSYKDIKKVIVALLISFVFGCKKEDKSLAITSLKFSDITQQYIKRNNIRKTFVIAGSDNIAMCKKLDTIGIYEYDMHGNTINVRRKANLFGHREEYEYDSLNFVTKKIFTTDFIATFNFRYEFDDDSLLLTKYYIRPTTDITEKDYSIPAGIYKFNKSGLIYESTAFENWSSGKGRNIITTYTYDDLGVLITKKVNYIKDTINHIIDEKSENTITYYYTDKKIDSTITIYSWLDNKSNKRHYTSKTIFDENGLKLMNITMDSVITYYKHIKY